jgi:hypothetical protein
MNHGLWLQTRIAKAIAAQYQDSLKIHPTSPTSREIGYGPTNQPNIELSDDDSTETNDGGGKMPAKTTNITSIIKNRDQWHVDRD